ncbi:MAG TPA: ATP-binding protein [Myxococcaceae bacterium]|nr:ATP-binding protein [Myxococcaceae bacterium]
MLDPTPRSPSQLGAVKERVLVVEGEGGLGASLRRALGESYELESAPDAERALDALSLSETAVLVAQADAGGEAMMARARELSPFTQGLLVAASDASALERAANGVQLLVAPSEARLAAAVAQAAELFHLRAEHERLSRLARAQGEELARLSAELDTRVEARTSALEVARRNWELTFDSLELPLAVVHADYSVARANRAFVRTAGKSASELATKPRCHQFFFGREAPCPGCPLPNALQQGREGRTELVHHDRTWVLDVSPMEGGQGVCSYRDVTEERGINQRLMQTEKMAAVGRLAGGVAHEINNPLGGILAFSQLMLRDKGRTPEDIESLSLIEESALRCKRIVESLLRFARASRGEDRRSTNLSRCVEDAAILFRAQMKSAPRAKLELELADALPEVVVDPARLAQVVLNLLQNGLDSLPKTEGTLTVSTGEQNGQVFFRVRDTGGGINKKDLPHIFEPHYTTRPPGDHKGLGLAIAYRIVEDHGGTFHVDTVPGTGSTFTVFLPVPSTQNP